ncbi:LacI family DNA-binding transcriptional regulator [Glaciihabitans sp. UYNi722]|uniref:LacI family DNA-binding transcriptional regulator n=1 Tax=Glaciihabitans sp. UYNi722 TaxID=3156344 RepID=UPI00339125FC
MVPDGEAPKRRATRADVARYAGVSPAVVSYTVNAGPRPVAAATRARVQDAIRVLGYRPNAAARTLKVGSTTMLGLIVPDSSNPFFAQFGHALEDVAAASGYALLVVNVSNTKDLALGIRRLASRQVDGMFIAVKLGMADLAALGESGTPAVLLNQSDAVSGLPTIGSDLYEGARQGVRHLIEHGHRTVAFVGESDPSEERQRGWRDALAAAGLELGPIAAAEFTRESGYAAGQSLLTLEQRPTAVFVSSDQQAVGVLRAFHEGGLSLPADIAIVSLDGSPEAEYSWPALTTVVQPVRDMAMDALERLVQPNAPTRFVQYATTLLIRQSCGCGHLQS